MTTPAAYLDAAIENAKTREASIRATEGKRIFSGHAWGQAVTPIGKISVVFVVASGRTTLRPEHMRQTWNLEGKRISKADLVRRLRETA